MIFCLRQEYLHSHLDQNLQANGCDLDLKILLKLLGLRILATGSEIISQNPHDYKALSFEIDKVKKTVKKAREIKNLTVLSTFLEKGLFLEKLCKMKIRSKISNDLDA